jgi:hypothetical protein
VNDLEDFETELRATLAQVEAGATPPAGLADRLVTNTTTNRTATVHRADFGARRWLPPLLAAAAVIALVVGGATVLSSTRADHRSPATQLPPAPTTSPSTPVATNTTPDPSPTISESVESIPQGTPVPPGFVAASVYFRDAGNGYAIGNVPCSATPGYCATLVRTTDGGASWLKIPLPGGLTPVDDQGNDSGGSCGTNGTILGPCVDKVAFADALHGYVYSFHQLYSTDDGGRTWTAEKAEDGQAVHVSQLATAGGSVVRLGPLSDCSSGCEVTVYRAAAGLSHWAASNPPGDAPILGSQLLAVGSDIYLSVRRVLTASNDIGGALYRTSDGGASWQLVNNGDCSGVLVATTGGGVQCDISGTAPWRTAGTISYRLATGGKAVEISTDGGKTSTPRSF